MSKHEFLIYGVQARELGRGDRVMQPFTITDDAHIPARIVNEIRPQFNQHCGRWTN